MPWLAQRGGVNAQDVKTASVRMTYVDGNNVDVSYGEIPAGQTAKAGYNKIEGGEVKAAKLEWGVSYITYIEVDASAIEGQIISATFTADFSGATDSGRQGIYGVGYNTSEWLSNMTYTTADRTITTLESTQNTKTKKASTFESKSFDIIKALKDDADKKVTILVYSTNPAGGYIKNPKVEITASTATLYTATFNEQNGLTPSVTIYTDEACTSEISADFLSDKTTYYYIAKCEGYEDYKGNFTVSGKDITVNFAMAEKPKFAYSVNLTSDNGILKCIYSNDQIYSGMTIDYSYPKYISDENGKVTYICSKNIYSGSVSPTGAGSTDIKYTKYDGVAYFQEVENVNNKVEVTNSKLSSGKAVRGVNNGKMKLIDVKETGVYNITYVLYSVNTRYDAEAPILCNEDIISPAPYDNVKWSINYVQTTGVKKIEGIILHKGDVVSAKPSSTNVAFDYVLIEKVSDLAPISSAKFATYSPSSNVIVPAVESGIKVYTAKVEGNQINLTEVEAGKVLEAGTGYVVAGEENSYEFALTKEAAEAIEGNDLKVATGEGLTATADTKYYVLTKRAEGVGFGKVATGVNIPAGKCYIDLTATASKATFLSFGGETTGISNVNAAKANANEYFSLQGVKTMKPNKGIYIHNGKKVVIK